VVSRGRRRYTIEIKPSAARTLRLLPAPVRGKLVAAIDALADEPRPSGCKKLAGQIDRYRVRAAGTYRIVYEIHDDRLIVVVIRVGHRRDVYRGL
jgi:mRNA interferase RelE/StbE